MGEVGMRHGQQVILPRVNHDRFILAVLVFGFLTLVFGAAIVALIAWADGIGGLVAFAAMGFGPAMLLLTCLVCTAGSLFLLLAMRAGWNLLSPGIATAPPFLRIDALSGETVDRHGRRWDPSRHARPVLLLGRQGPASIVFPEFDRTGPAPTGPQASLTFLQRAFVRVFLGARGPEVAGLIVPLQFLSDREAILAAIRPIAAPVRWW